MLRLAIYNAMDVILNLNELEIVALCLEFQTKDRLARRFSQYVERYLAEGHRDDDSRSR